ncbi:hypothetical protein [Aeromonas sobria]|uniref:hypothetical protein n=1 Tax=Aeromonas sobria TaxID=646 RepID=UPI003D014B10
MNKTSLLLSLLLAHGAAFAAPPSKHDDGFTFSSGDMKLDIDWDQQEYRWWQNNCLDLGIGDSRVQFNCDQVDGKYRDHYNRSIHSGNNPGQGHNKQKNHGNGKKP